MSALLIAGAPWNAIDRRGYCAGNHALENGHQRIVDALVEHAVRCELLLGASERRARNENSVESEEYLKRSFVLAREGEAAEALIDEQGDAVMMQWEAPLMEAHAEALCAARGDVLNLGFGMGIIDTAIAARGPRTHTIVEAHPQVHGRMLRDGWHTRPGVTVLFGRWQEVLEQLRARVASMPSSTCAAPHTTAAHAREEGGPRQIDRLLVA